ncbi:MAG: hypothetical protein IKY98_00345 [Alphaproteobacteria bacterium]|nr:hypothetical protein [Alphaproteobacteria bacterium]
MATQKKTKTPTTKKVVPGSASTIKKSSPTPQKTKENNLTKSTETKPMTSKEKVTHEQAYLGLSIALTGVLYFILLFLTYIYFNYDIMFFPKA